MWFEGIEVVVLGDGGAGGDDQKSDLNVVLSNKSVSELEKRGDVTISGAWKEGDVGFGWSVVRHRDKRKS